MNIYGCIPPATFLPSHSTLTYWAQAASLAGLGPSDSSLVTSGSLALGLKQSQLPLNICDVIRKNRSAGNLRAGSNFSRYEEASSSPSPFRVTSRVSSSDVSEALVSVDDQERLHLQLQMHMQHLQQRYHHHQRQQQQQQQQREARHQQHRPSHHQPFSTSSPPPVGNGLAPLQALCESDVSSFRGKSASDPGSPTGEHTSGREGKSASGGDGTDLKFGISRILSEDFGKAKESTFQLSSVPEECRSLPLCPCSSAQCTAYAPRPLSPAHHYPGVSLPSLSAVHALQPPCYPLNSSVDALPGPYSILSSDPSSGSHQPKRKRSWSRAVFSNLQRKGLEKRFEVQKYVTKPDRRQLAAMLGLTDAQVKVWFQNRRMKWRHAQQQEDKEKQTTTDFGPSGDQDEMRNYQVQSDQPPENGLDLRRVTAEETDSVELDASSSQTSTVAADEVQSLGMLNKCLMSPKIITPNLSPAVVYCGITPKEHEESNTSTSVSSLSPSKVTDNMAAFMSNESRSDVNRAIFFAEPIAFSRANEVITSMRQREPSMSLMSTTSRHTNTMPPESDVFVLLNTSRVQCSDVHASVAADDTVCEAENNRSFDTRPTGEETLHNIPESSDDEGTATHIDVDV